MRPQTEPTARDFRADRTLMGIGPLGYGHGQPAAAAASRVSDGVPTLRIEREPPQPIVVDPRAGVLRTQAPEIPIDETAVVRVAPRRIDSVVSARFFQEGELQEANGWENSPLAQEPL